MTLRASFSPSPPPSLHGGGGVSFQIAGVSPAGSVVRLAATADLFLSLLGGRFWLWVDTPTRRALSGAHR